LTEFNDSQDLKPVLSELSLLHSRFQEQRTGIETFGMLLSDATPMLEHAMDPDNYRELLSLLCPFRLLNLAMTRRTWIASLSTDAPALIRSFFPVILPLLPLNLLRRPFSLNLYVILPSSLFLPAHTSEQYREPTVTLTGGRQVRSGFVEDNRYEFTISC